jgi:uncharacterized membrane protein (DUF106 family)
MDFTEWLLMSDTPGATVMIMLICMVISLVNSSINRLLISRFVGWSQYKIMQKELSEYRAETTEALRTKDKKAIEKLKKKESQIRQMQTKLAKPQLILFGLSFSYILVWLFILGPMYGTNTVAYIPGIGKITVFWWYFICSFLLGTVASRLLNILSIE